MVSAPPTAIAIGATTLTSLKPTAAPCRVVIAGGTYDEFAQALRRVTLNALEWNEDAQRYLPIKLFVNLPGGGVTKLDVYEKGKLFSQGYGLSEVCSLRADKYSVLALQDAKANNAPPGGLNLGGARRQNARQYQQRRRAGSSARYSPPRDDRGRFRPKAGR
jgi:hypothetical protein